MLKLITAVAIIASAPAPAPALASPSCTNEPKSKSKWMSEDAMKAEIDTLGYKVKTQVIKPSLIYGRGRGWPHSTK